ncbi:MAG: esterase family protein [Clostridia bacterium]|nr:esterase family protein [Clostridia bacterium]
MALVHLDFHSDVLQMAVNVDVILPQAPTTQVGMGGKRESVFPTLYLLHGLSDDHTIWQRRTSIERYAARYGIAVVMPNAHRSWYTDMAHGGKYFTYVSEELPTVCRSFFRGMSEAREYNYVAGLSMGGYGALKVAMANPTRYAGVASFSGAIDVYKYCLEEGYVGHRSWGDVFGSVDNIVGTVNDVYGTAERQIAAGATMPKIYLSCGTEDGFLPATQKMRAVLEKGGVAHAYREAPGNHTWEFWDDEIQRAIAYFFG